MDSSELAERYMAEYNKLVEKHESKIIVELIEGINKAVSDADMNSVNSNYNKLSEWNEHVANMQGARTALNTQFKYLRLPSVSEFMVIFDHINKEWRFNTDAD